MIGAIVAGRLTLSRRSTPAGTSEPGRYLMNVRHAVDDRTAASLGLDPESCFSVRQGAEALSVSVRMILVWLPPGASPPPATPG